MELRRLLPVLALGIVVSISAQATRADERGAGDPIEAATAYLEAWKAGAPAKCVGLLSPDFHETAFAGKKTNDDLANEWRWAKLTGYTLRKTGEVEGSSGSQAWVQYEAKISIDDEELERQLMSRRAAGQKGPASAASLKEQGDHLRQVNHTLRLIRVEGRWFVAGLHMFCGQSWEGTDLTPARKDPAKK